MRGGERWGFGRFVVDARERQLLCEGQVVPLTQRAFTLLVALLGRPGQLFTKAELFDTVWSGRVVTEAALSRAIHELRCVLGDDAVAPRFIATAHGLGFRFVAPVAAVPAAAGGERPEAAARRLVGRAAELDELERAFDDARAGHRRLVFVTGEAGIGKTALVESFLERHAAREAPWVAQGRCIEPYGTGEAFLPILEALEQLSREVGAAPFRAVLALYAPAWLAQLPWLAHDAAPPLVPTDSADATPRRMLLELAQALEALAARKPIVLWLEDLHWSDSSSLAALSFLAGRRDAARLLLVATFRPADAAPTASPLHALALRLEQRGQAREIPLAALDEGAVRRMLALRLGSGEDALVHTLAAFLHRRSEGNALFAVTLVDDLIRRARLQRVDGAWRLQASIAELGNDLPESLRQLVHEQYEHLAEADRRVVEAAAITGADFSAAAVAAALQDDTVEVEERCAQLARQGRFLRTQATTTWPDRTLAAGFGFLHALYCQGIAERVPHGRRVEWQRRIALRQEQAYGAQCSAIAAELAMRFRAAHDLERSVRYLQLAGTAALSRCAYPECIASLRQGLALLPELPAALQPRQELDLLLPLGAALMAAKGYADDEVDATYVRARALCLVCARPGDLERVLRGQWNVAFIRADLAGAIAIAEQLLGHAEAARDADLALDAHVKLGQTLLHQGELTLARRHLEPALRFSIAAETSRARAAPRVAIYLAWALWYAGEGTQAQQRAEEALLLSHDAGSPHSTAFALGYGMILHVLRGDLARALELAPQLIALTAEHGLVYWKHVSDFVEGMIAARRGDPSAGADAMERATQAMRGGGARVGVPYLLYLIAEARLACGDLAEARRALEDAGGLVAASGNALYAAEGARLEGDLALAEARETGGRGLAEQRYLRALALAREQSARAFELRAAISLARLHAAEGEVRRAIHLLTPVHAAFTEDFDTADWLQAKALLEAWQVASVPAAEGSADDA